MSKSNIERVLSTEQLLKLPAVVGHVNAASKFLATEMPTMFSGTIKHRFFDLESPIEAIFAVWWEAMACVSSWLPAVWLLPQRTIQVGSHRYRVDFEVHAGRSGQSVWEELIRDGERLGRPIPRIAIELDGHDFHERTKEQVSLRNRRDRELQTAGWTVFHFSGAEICRDPTPVFEAHTASRRLFDEWMRDILDIEYLDSDACAVKPYRSFSMSNWTLADVRAVQARHAIAVPPRRKFGNQPVTIDGYGFDSKKEGEHYLHLKMRLRLDEITDLELQPVFQLYVKPERVLAEFTPDFRYWERVPIGYVPAPRERRHLTTRAACGGRQKLRDQDHGLPIAQAIGRSHLRHHDSGSLVARSTYLAWQRVAWQLLG
jgi:hypothetical protein